MGTLNCIVSILRTHQSLRVLLLLPRLLLSSLLLHQEGVDRDGVVGRIEFE